MLDAAWDAIDYISQDSLDEFRAAICAEIDPGVDSELVRPVPQTEAFAYPLSIGYLICYIPMEDRTLKRHNDQRGTAYEKGIVIVDILHGFGYPQASYLGY
jgi:hypothetical protein